MTKIRSDEITLHRTTDGEQFDRLHKAEAHQAAVDIREMLVEDGRWDTDAVDTIMEAVRTTLIYVPQAIWQDLLK